MSCFFLFVVVFFSTNLLIQIPGNFEEEIQQVYGAQNEWGFFLLNETQCIREPTGP